MTITSRSTLSSVLEETREQGWAINDEEREPYVRTWRYRCDPPTMGLGAVAVQGLRRA